MIKILIPTDFSEASKKAIYYGMHLAKKLEAEIHLVNMIHVETFTHAAVAVHMTIVEEQVRKMAQREMEKLVSELGKQFSTLRLVTAILQGEYLHHTLRSYANETGQDLIIMGTRGASGILGDILGSNAADMIAHSTVPVLAIPPESVYEPNSKIILTTDFKNLEPKLRIMAPLVVILQSDLILFHVSTDGSITVQEGEELCRRLSSEFNLPGMKPVVVRNEKIDEAIQEFALANRPCILAMFTHKPGFFEKLFGKSVTRKTVLHTHVPLLALKL